MTPIARRLATLTGSAAAIIALLPAAGASAWWSDRPAEARPAPGVCTAISGGSRVFLGLLDFRSYVLVPGGDFENGAPGWTLQDGARVAARQGTNGSTAIALPSGASLTSPVFCIDETNPSFRLSAVAGSLLGSRIRATLLWTDVAGTVHETPVGSDFSFPILSIVWRVTGSMQLARVLPLPDGATTPVQLRFTGRWGGALLDDVYIDPARGR